MEDKKLINLFEEVSQASSPHKLPDFWPGIRETILNRQEKLQAVNKLKEVNNMKKDRRKITWGFSFASVALALVLFIALTPAGKTLAQAVIHFFHPQEPEQLSLPAPTVELETVVPPAFSSVMVPVGEETQTPVDCNESGYPSCPLDKAVLNLDYQPNLPSALPEGFEFQAAKAQANQLQLVYTSKTGSLILTQSLIDDQPVTYPVGKNAHIVATTVSGQPAEYVEGFWMSGNSPQTLEWQANDAARTLVWQDNTRQYHLVAMGAKVENSMRMPLTDMVKLAESVSPATVAQTTESEQLSAEELARTLGFTFTQPERIPLGFIKSGAVSNPEWGAVCQYFEPYGKSGWPLILAEWTGNLPTLDQLRIVDPVNGYRIETFIENLPLQTAEDGLASYLSNGLTSDEICGSKDTAANQVLMWKQDKRAFVLFAPVSDHSGGSYVTKNELLQMAAQLNGQPLENTAVIDPERILSLQDAEKIYGGTVYFPGKMPPGYHLQNFIVWDQKDGNGVFTTFVKTADLEFANFIQSPAGYSGPVQAAEGESTLSFWGGEGFFANNCFPDYYDPNNTHCSSHFRWQEQGTDYSISFQTLEPMSAEAMLTIVESMKP